MSVEVANLAEGFGASVARDPGPDCDRFAVVRLSSAGSGPMQPWMSFFSFLVPFDQCFNPRPLFLFSIVWHV